MHVASCSTAPRSARPAHDARAAHQARRARPRHAALPPLRRARPTSCISSGCPSSTSTRICCRPPSGAGAGVRWCSPRTTSSRASPAPGSSPPSGGCTSASTRSSSTPRTVAHRLTDELGVDPARVHVIPHGALAHPLTAGPRPSRRRCARQTVPSCCSSGCCVPTRGSTCCSTPGGEIDDAELWIVGMPRFDISALRRSAPPNVRFVPRFVVRRRAARVLSPRRPRRASLPRDRPVGRCCSPRSAFGVPLLLSDVGGFPELARDRRRAHVPRGRRPRPARRAAASCCPTPTLCQRWPSAPAPPPAARTHGTRSPVRRWICTAR